MGRYSSNKVSNRESSRTAPIATNMATANPLQSLEIQAPRIQSQAAPVNSYIQAGKPSHPGTPILSDPELSPEPAETTDLQNIANAFQSLNTNLQSLGNNFAAVQKVRNEEKRLDAQKLVQQVAQHGTPGKPETLIKLQKAATKSAAAQKLLNKYEAAVGNRFIKEAIAERQYLLNLSGSEEKWKNISTVTNDAGEQIDIRDLPSDDPLVQRALSETLYGDLDVGNLSNKSRTKYNHLSVQKQASLLAAHDKRHQTHVKTKKNVEEINKIRSLVNTKEASSYDIQIALQEGLELRYLWVDGDSGKGWKENLGDQLVELLKELPRDTEEQITAANEMRDKVKQAYLNLETGPAIDFKGPKVYKRNKLIDTLETQKPGSKNDFMEKMENIESELADQENKIEEQKGKDTANIVYGEFFTPEAIETPEGRDDALLKSITKINSDISLSATAKAEARETINNRYNSFATASSIFRKDRVVSYTENFYDALGNADEMLKLKNNILEEIKKDPGSRSMYSDLLTKVNTEMKDINEDIYTFTEEQIDIKEEDMMTEITSPTSWDGNEQTQQELNEKGNVISKMKKDTYKIVKEGRKEGLSESAIREKLTKYFDKDFTQFGFNKKAKIRIVSSVNKTLESRSIKPRFIRNKPPGSYPELVIDIQNNLMYHPDKLEIILDKFFESGGTALPKDVELLIRGSGLSIEDFFKYQLSLDEYNTQSKKYRNKWTDLSDSDRDLIRQYSLKSIPSLSSKTELQSKVVVASNLFNNNVFVRQVKDEALINDDKDNKLINETLIAGNLQAGMLADNYDGKGLSKKKSNLRTKILDTIHSGESTVDKIGKGYEAFNQGGADKGKKVLGFSGTYGNHPANKGKKLVNMTIQEILNIQDSGYDTKTYPMTEEGWKKWYKSGGIHAAGRYQFVNVALRDAMELANIKPTEKFTPQIQDKLAMALLLNRGQDKWVSMQGNKELQKLLEEFNKTEAKESSTIDTSSGLA